MCALLDFGVVCCSLVLWVFIVVRGLLVFGAIVLDVCVRCCWFVVLLFVVCCLLLAVCCCVWLCGWFAVVSLFVVRCYLLLVLKFVIVCGCCVGDVCWWFRMCCWCCCELCLFVGCPFVVCGWCVGCGC